MNEKQLQSKIVMWFNQEFLQGERGMLWATLNRTLSRSDGQTQKAMGLVKGVPDLLYFEEGTLGGFELKQKGSRHDANHIRQQYNWGVELENQDGFYFIVTSLEGFKSLILDDGPEHDDIYTLEEIKELLDKNTKTIVF